MLEPLQQMKVPVARELRRLAPELWRSLHVLVEADDVYRYPPVGQPVARTEVAARLPLRIEERPVTVRVSIRGDRLELGPQLGIAEHFRGVHERAVVGQREIGRQVAVLAPIADLGLHPLARVALGAHRDRDAHKLR